MSDFVRLSMFLVLAFLLPGLVISSSVLLLFPQLSQLVTSTRPLELVGIVFVIALITAHPPFWFEWYVLDYIWDKMYPTWKLRARRELIINRARLIAQAEHRGIAHGHYDQTLGEFILFNNTACWLVVIALVQLLSSPFGTPQTLFAVVMLIGAVVTVLFACPFFKKSYIDILETLEKDLKGVSMPTESKKK